MKRFYPDAIQYICRRSPLYHFRQAMESGEVTVGILGGSISEQIFPSWEQQRWPDKLTSWLAASFPEVRVNVENASKAATGSESALFRVEQDILSRSCDIVFVEYAVNDKDMPELERNLCREGLLRKLLCCPDRQFDVVVVLTCYRGAIASMLAGEQYPSVADFERLCDHYRLTSVDVGAYGLSQLLAGSVRYEEWLPDTTHPGDVGSRIYAEAVEKLLEEELATAAPVDMPVPASLFPENWQYAHKLDPDSIRRVGPWRCDRVYRIPTVERMLRTASPGAALEFSFTGTGMELFVVVNAYTAGYRVRVDGGEWKELTDPRPAWCDTTPDWIRCDMLTGFTRGQHQVRLETYMAENGRGTNFELCDVGIIP